MTDIRNVGALKNAGAKPRLSLLSSKQSVRIKSEDSPTDHSQQRTSQNNFTTNLTSEIDEPEIALKESEQTIATTTIITTTKLDSNESKLIRCNNLDNDSRSASNASDGQALSSPNLAGLEGGEHSSQDVDLDKMSVSKEDLIRLLSMLKSELHSKELALASIKLEQLKRLMNPVEISRSSLANTYIKLQNRLRDNDLNNKNCNSNNNNSTQSSALDKKIPHKTSSFNEDEVVSTNSTLDSNKKSIVNTSNGQAMGMMSQGGDNLDDDERDRENFTILNTLLELLDRHPLLALPRDSIYCLDYNCNELSTKNYLNLKVQHLENLIDQHRRFRYFIGERLKRSEQRYMDLTLKLEFERNLRMKNEREAYENGGKTTLLKEIDQLKESLEKEKASKHAIVMTLLNELMDERERNEILSQKLVEIANNNNNNNNNNQSSDGCYKPKTKPSLLQQQSSVAGNSNQPTTVCKPRVPAKPAQLLDRQLSQTKNR